MTLARAIEYNRVLTWISLVTRELPHTLPPKPFRFVLRLQFLVTLGIASAAGLMLGVHGAVSALLGGTVMLVAGVVYALMVRGDGVRSAGQVLRTLLRAEAAKVGLIVFQLWLVLTAYEQVVPAVFVGTFAVAVLIYPVALLVRE